jgi:hypothetical protein
MIDVKKINFNGSWPPSCPEICFFGLLITSLLIQSHHKQSILIIDSFILFYF